MAWVQLLDAPEGTESIQARGLQDLRRQVNRDPELRGR